MQWGSPSEFFAMGGYGFYVWISFGATAVCMVWEVVVLRHRHKMAAKREAAAEGLSKS